MVTVFILVLNGKGKHQAFRSLANALSTAATIFEYHPDVTSAHVVTAMGHHVLELLRPGYETEGRSPISHALEG